MKGWPTRRILALILAVDVLLLGAFVFVITGNRNVSPDREISESSIRKICELATLECFYHNVSDWSQSAYNFLGYGAKKVWIEYDGFVRAGINAGKVRISRPDRDGVVTVTIPKATILEKDLDETTINEIDSEFTVLGLFTDAVNTEDRRKALAGAQEDMAQTAAKNEIILEEAQNRARMIIERNIVALGEASGKKWTVRFTEEADTLPAPAGGGA